MVVQIGVHLLIHWAMEVLEIPPALEVEGRAQKEVIGIVTQLLRQEEPDKLQPLRVLESPEVEVGEEAFTLRGQSVRVVTVVVAQVGQVVLLEAQIWEVVVVQETLDMLAGQGVLV